MDLTTVLKNVNNLYHMFYKHKKIAFIAKNVKK